MPVCIAAQVISSRRVRGGAIGGLRVQGHMTLQEHAPKSANAMPLVRIHQADLHQFESRIRDRWPPRARLLWLPGFGIPERPYDPFGQELRACGLSLASVDYRGCGSSNTRSSRHSDWGYHTVISQDLQKAVDDLPKDSVPLWIGGHSIGGQFPCLLASIRAESFNGIVAVASGSPHWRHRRGSVLPWLAFAAYVRLVCRAHGHYPGRMYGLAGNEAHGMVRDWTTTVMTGRYTFRDVDTIRPSPASPFLP